MVKTYVKQTKLPVSAEEAFEWHKRKGAFERLVPPFEAVKLETGDIEISNGSRAKLSIKTGPINLKWIAEHQNVEEGVGFTDVQIDGPFQYWKHSHSFKPHGTGCLLEDKIEYRVMSDLTDNLIIGLVEEKLEKVFRYRHEVTKSDLELIARNKEVKAMKVLVTGSSGLVGSALIPLLSTQGHVAKRLLRPSSKTNGGDIQWTPSEDKLNPQDLEGFDAIIHLAGDNIADGRWTDEKKRRLKESRIKSTNLLVNAMSQLEKPPSTFICASAVGFYGDRDNETLTEDSSAGDGFLADLCKEWEAAAQKASENGVRVVNIRIGVVLSPKGGMLEKVLTPFSLGAGGNIGSGKQYMSWISIDDLVGAIYHCLTTEELSGPVNLVAPSPVTNAEFTKSLGKVLGRPTIFPIPDFGAKLVFGEMAEELMLSSCKATPTKLESTGFKFSHPQIESALRGVLGKS